MLVNTLLGVGFGVIASRAGEHWNVTQDETESIAAPLVKILDRLNITEKVEKYGDWAALGVALGLVIVPRVMMTVMEEKKNDEKAALAVVAPANDRSNEFNRINKNDNHAVLGSALG